MVRVRYGPRGDGVRRRGATARPPRPAARRARRRRRAVPVVGRRFAHDLRCVLSRRRRRPPDARRRRRARRRSGSVTTADRCGDGAVACGNAMAATNCAWKSGLGGRLDLHDRRARRPPSRARAATDSSARTAPAPAALPTERTRSTGQSGTRPSTSAYTGSMWLPNAPASRMSCDLGDAGVLEQQLDAGAQRGLGQLDGAHVVLGDGTGARRRPRARRS